jgi:alanine dehydrogenase
MPGAVPRTATTALTNATLPFVLALAESGRTALSRDGCLLAGVATVAGHLTCEPVAAAAGRPFVPASDALTTTAPSAILRQATTSHHRHQHGHR